MSILEGKVALVAGATRGAGTESLSSLVLPEQLYTAPDGVRKKIDPKWIVQKSSMRLPSS